MIPEIGPFISDTSKAKRGLIDFRNAQIISVRSKFSLGPISRCFQEDFLLQNSNVCRVSKVSLICSYDKVSKVAFVRLK